MVSPVSSSGLQVQVKLLPKYKTQEMFSGLAGRTGVKSQKHNFSVQEPSLALDSLINTFQMAFARCSLQSDSDIPFEELDFYLKNTFYVPNKNKHLEAKPTL